MSPCDFIAWNTSFQVLPLRFSCAIRSSVIDCAC